MLRSPTPVLRAILARRSVVVSSRQFTRKMAQNSAQGGSHASTGKKSSDTAWLVGSIAVTVPSVISFSKILEAKSPAELSCDRRFISSTLLSQKSLIITPITTLAALL